MNETGVEKTLMGLLNVPSVITQEQEISQYIIQQLDPLPGFSRESIGLSHVYQTSIDSNKPTLAFYGHMDTVINQQEQSPHFTPERIYGCGSSDMKGGVAVMFELMKSFASENGAPYNLQFVYYDQEEGPYESNGLGPVLDSVSSLQKCQLALGPEPTNNVVQIGCLGGLHAKVTFIGKSCHSARPWEGTNALHMAGPLLTRLLDLERREVNFQGLQYFEVISATLATAGGSRNSVPGTFELNLNYRFAPGKTIAVAKEELLDFIGNQPEIEFVDECPSANVVLGNPILDAFQGRFGIPSEPKQAWTDIARLGLYNIPAVNCGPGDPAQAHQKNEWISRQALNQGLTLFSDFLFR